MDKNKLYHWLGGIAIVAVLFTVFVGNTGLFQGAVNQFVSQDVDFAMIEPIAVDAIVEGELADFASVDLAVKTGGNYEKMIFAVGTDRDRPMQLENGVLFRAQDVNIKAAIEAANNNRVIVSFSAYEPNSNSPVVKDYLFKATDVVENFLGDRLVSGNRITTGTINPNYSVPNTSTTDLRLDLTDRCNTPATANQDKPVIRYELSDSTVNQERLTIKYSVCANIGYLDEVNFVQQIPEDAAGNLKTVEDKVYEFAANDQTITKELSDDVRLYPGENIFTVNVVTQPESGDPRDLGTEFNNEQLKLTYDPETVAQDTVKPTIQVLRAELNGNVYQVRGLVYDNVAVDQLEYSYNGSQFNDVSFTDAGYFELNLDRLQEGNSSVELQATDNSGNKSDVRLLRFVYEDRSDDDLAVTARIVGDLRVEVENNKSLDVLIINLYERGSDQAVRYGNVFYHCRIGQYDGCPSYEPDVYSDRERIFTVANSTVSYLDEGDYRYKVVAIAGDETEVAYSNYFSFDPDEYADLILPAEPEQPCYYYFSDLNSYRDNPACNYIAFTRERGIFYGVPGPSGTYNFEPRSTFTRAQLFATAVRFGEIPVREFNPQRDAVVYPDLERYRFDINAEWFLDAIKSIDIYAGKRIIQGDGGLAAVERDITVAEAYKVITQTAIETGMLDVRRYGQPSLATPTAGPWWTLRDQWYRSVGLPIAGPNGGRAITRVEVAEFFAAMFERGLVR